MMTIWMLYTAWALIIASGLLWRLISGPKCPHLWELVDKVEFPSIGEEARRLGMVLNDIKGMENIQAVYEKKVKIVLRCPKCGTSQILHLRG